MICFFYGNIATIDYFCMLSCFLFYFCDTISQILHITFNIGNIRFDVCNIPFNLGNIPFNLRYSIIGCFQLTTIHCIGRGTRNFTSSHTTNFAALINGNPIVDCYSAFLVKFYRGLVIRNSISSDIHICQFSSLICIDFIFCRNKASRFNSAIGSANAYILASDIAEKNILIQAYFICLLAILIGFFYSNVATIDDLAVLTCFGCYCMQLAAVYSVSGISSYCACCYAGNLTILVEGNLAVDYGIAILHVDRCALAVNHTCSSCCTIQCDFGFAIRNCVAAYGNISKLSSLIGNNAIFCCDITSCFDRSISSANADVIASKFAKENIIIQADLVNLLTINICFFDTDIAAIDDLAVLTCFGCYCMQLAAVYSVSRISSNCTCCYAGNLAVFSNSYFAQLSAFSINVAVVTVIIGK